MNGRYAFDFWLRGRDECSEEETLEWQTHAREFVQLLEKELHFYVKNILPFRRDKKQWVIVSPKPVKKEEQLEQLRRGYTGKSLKETYDLMKKIAMKTKAEIYLSPELAPGYIVKVEVEQEFKDGSITYSMNTELTDEEKTKFKSIIIEAQDKFFDERERISKIISETLGKEYEIF